MVSQYRHRLSRGVGDVSGRQAGAARSGDGVRYFRQRRGLTYREMEALTLRPVTLSAKHERLDHVVDVDRVQPDLVAANGPEPVPEDGLEERKEVMVAWPIYQAGPGDDRWKATAPRLTDRPLGFGLRLLIDVGRADRRVLVSRLVPRHPEDPSGAAVNEPPRRGPVLAVGEEKLRSLHMRPLVLRCWNARYEQSAR